MALLRYARATAGGGQTEKINYVDLMKRDIIEAIRIDDSHFLATEENGHVVVVPSLAPELAVRPHPSYLPKHN